MFPSSLCCKCLFQYNDQTHPLLCRLWPNVRLLNDQKERQMVVLGQMESWITHLFITWMSCWQFPHHTWSSTWSSSDRSASHIYTIRLNRRVWQEANIFHTDSHLILNKGFELLFEVKQSVYLQCEWIKNILISQHCCAVLTSLS